MIRKENYQKRALQRSLGPPSTNIWTQSIINKFKSPTHCTWHLQRSTLIDDFTSSKCLLFASSFMSSKMFAFKHHQKLKKITPHYYFTLKKNAVSHVLGLKPSKEPLSWFQFWQVLFLEQKFWLIFMSSKKTVATDDLVGKHCLLNKMATFLLMSLELLCYHRYQRRWTLSLWHGKEFGNVSIWIEVTLDWKLMAVDTIGNCQRPAFSWCISTYA